MEKDKKIIVDGKTFYNEAAADIYIKNKKPKNYLTSFLFRFSLIFLAFFVGSILITPSYYFVLSVAILVSLKHALLTVITFDLGEWLFKKFRNLKFNSVTQAEKKEAYLRAMEEIETDSMDKFTKAQAIEKSNGDTSKIHSIYITLRTKELTSRK